MKVLRPFRTFGYYTTAFTLTPAMGLTAGVAALAGDRRGRVWWWASRSWARGMLGAAGVTDFIVKGIEQIYDGAPYVLMCNHVSHLDPPAIIRSSDRPIGFLTKHELSRIPIFGWALERTGHVFIDRKRSDRSHESIDKAASQVAAGRCILVFPEGTRSKSGEPLPFKKGGFVLAMKAGAAIVPVAIAGTASILPAKAKAVAERSAVAVVYGTPIPTAGLDRDTLMATIRAAMLACRDDAEALVAERQSRPA